MITEEEEDLLTNHFSEGRLRKRIAIVRQRKSLGREIDT